MMESADGDDMKIGVRTAADLGWKDGLDAFTCTECGRCKDACPTFLTGKPLALKWVFDHLKEHLVEERDAIVARNADALPPLVPAVIGDDTLWACTTCGYCESACPIELEHLPRFYRLRQHQVMMEGAFPHELKAVFDAYEAQSNPWGMPADTRGDWARGLDLPVVTTAADVQKLDWLFYVGSAQSFDPRGQKIARAFVTVMRAAQVRIGILGARRDLDRRMRAARRQRIAVPDAREGARRDAERARRHADRHLRPARLQHAKKRISRVRRPLRSHSSHAADRAASRRRPACARTAARESDLPRAVLSRAPQRRIRGAAARAAPLSAPDAPLEFALAREKAMCCGAGGARMFMEETIGRRINVTRVEQALTRAPAVIATACPYCAVMMSDGISALGQEGSVATRDIAELVAESLSGSRRDGMTTGAPVATADQ